MKYIKIYYCPKAFSHCAILLSSSCARRSRAAPKACWARARCSVTYFCNSCRRVRHLEVKSKVITITIPESQLKRMCILLCCVVLCDVVWLNERILAALVSFIQWDQGVPNISLFFYHRFDFRIFLFLLFSSQVHNAENLHFKAVTTRRTNSTHSCSCSNGCRKSKRILQQLLY